LGAAQRGQLQLPTPFSPHAAPAPERVAKLVQLRFTLLVGKQTGLIIEFGSDRRSQDHSINGEVFRGAP
jgi:hypothetical protein